MLTAIDTLVDAGYPPEAVLIEIYLSGELAYSQEAVKPLRPSPRPHAGKTEHALNGRGHWGVRRLPTAGSPCDRHHRRRWAVRRAA
jgi:hypothetical protein